MIKETNTLLKRGSIASLQRAAVNLKHIRKILPIGEKALKTHDAIRKLRRKKNLSKRQARKLRILECRLIGCLAEFHEDLSRLEGVDVVVQINESTVRGIAIRQSELQKQDRI